VSIDVSVVGSSTADLEELVRASGMRVTAAPSIESLKPRTRDTQAARVVILDLRDQARVPPALASLKKERPATGIVVVASKLEPSLMLEAMRAGVSECVAEPVTRTDLAAAIARVGADGQTPATGEVLALLGAKGGVGVTTLAVNVATALAQKAPGSVLLIDLHPACGDAAVFLGAEPQHSTLDALENTTRLDESYLKGLVARTKAGPDLLASPDRVVAVQADAPRVRAVVEVASRCYRYVVLDVDGQDPSVAGALELASSITLVTTQDVAALRNGHRLAAFLRARYGPDRIRFVLNRFDRSDDIGDADLERALGGPVCGTLPEAGRLAVDALNKGFPIVAANHSTLSGALTRYAQSLVSGGSEPETHSDRTPGLFGLLNGRRRAFSR
jgi:pilus assembly protein CpaE